MENFGFKGLLVTLYQRVILSYKTTLIGLGFVSIDATLSYLQAVNFPSWAHYVVGVVSGMFALLKEQSGIPPLVPAAPKGFARIGALVVLSGAMLALTGATCQRPSPVVVDVLRCGEAAIVKRIPDLTLQIVSILRAGGAGWQGALLTLVEAAGEAGQCAWAVVMAQIEGGLTLSDRPREAVPADVAARAAEFQALLEARAASARAAR